MNQPVPPPDEMIAIFRRDSRNPQLALFAGAELEAAGRFEEAVAIWSLGDDVDPAVRHVQDNEQAHPLMREHSRRAAAAMRTFFSDLHRRSVDEYAAQSGADLKRVGDGIWTMTHDADFAFETDMQRPTVFYMPDLPAAPVADKSVLPWAAAIEEVWQDIRDEFLAAAQLPEVMEPYVPANSPGIWQKLGGTLDWSAIYLHKNAHETRAAKHFPKTLDALGGADLVSIDGVPIESFFSRLVCGTHIPPHNGLTNSRLTVHLPLIVPENCAIRVGEGNYHWREGEIIAFDDSYEHEAWNGSESDRVVLIFETHHPDLSQPEREAIEHGYTVRQQWLDGRKALLGLSG